MAGGMTVAYPTATSAGVCYSNFWATSSHYLTIRSSLFLCRLLRIDVQQDEDFVSDLLAVLLAPVDTP